MFFHKSEFLLFFLIVFPVYLLLRRSNGAMNLWLLAASYVFYGWWNPWYLVLIAATTTLDWYIGLRLSDPSSRKKRWLCLTLISNLGMLAFFKYADFFTENLNIILAKAGAASSVKNPARLLMESLHMEYVLPVGISFFTFQSMSYTIDVYRGQIPVERSLLRFATFVSLFPQLVAGPIERASNLLPQLQTAPKITLEDVAEGASRFLVGLFKKIAMADFLSKYVDRIYNNPGEYDAPALLMATFAFAWQIYFDFSGYTDMARGIGRAMGFRFMMNFNNPYVATGLGDFWNRWHLSLSTWFKDYVYFPLGGNRGTKFQTYRNMVITMMLSGIWHGAAWGFVVWGALHALGRVVTRELELTAFYRDRVPTVVKQLGVFVFVCITWIFFRGQTWGTSWTVVSRIFTTKWTDPRFPIPMLLLILAIWTYQFLHRSSWKGRLLEPAPVRLGLAAAMFVWLAVVAQSGNQAFIYFQF